MNGVGTRGGRSGAKGISAPSTVAQHRGDGPAIVLVTESDAPSGMGRQMLTLARGLAASHRVIVAAPIGRDARWLLGAAREAGLETWPLPDDPGAIGPALRRRLLADDIDLVNVHAGIGWEGHTSVRAAREAAAPFIVRTEHLPFLLTEPSHRASYAAGLADVDRVITVSRGVAASHLDAGVPADRVRTVANGIEDPLRRPPSPLSTPAAVRSRLGIPGGAPLIVSVGRLAPQKGFDILLSAAPAVLRRSPNARFLIVGSGPLDPWVDARISELGLGDAVHRLRHSSDVPALLADATAVALPSRFEGLPLVALEAMAMGRPVVGTRVCGLDETVAHRITGLLAPPEDVRAFAAALCAVLEDPATAGAYGRAGRARFEREFTADRMVADTALVFEELWGVTKTITAAEADRAARPGASMARAS